jgi:hypothetical protein
MNAMSKLATFAAIAASACALTSAANAAEESHIFQSVLSTPSATWCIAVPGGEYQAGKHVLIAACNGQPNQTFSYGDGANLTAGAIASTVLPRNPANRPARAIRSASQNATAATTRSGNYRRSRIGRACSPSPTRMACASRSTMRP